MFWYFAVSVIILCLAIEYAFTRLAQVFIEVNSRNYNALLANISKQLDKNEDSLQILKSIMQHKNCGYVIEKLNEELKKNKSVAPIEASKKDEASNILRDLIQRSY